MKKFMTKIFATIYSRASGLHLLLKACLLAGLLCCSSAVFAVKLSTLYTGEVPLPSGVSLPSTLTASSMRPALKKAFQDALEQVLIKLTGNSAVMTLPTVRAEFPQVIPLVQSYVTTSLDLHGLASQYLTVSFDRKVLQARLQQAQQALWNPDRPQVLLYLIWGHGAQAKLLTADTAGSMLQYFKLAARFRGMPIVFPHGQAALEKTPNSPPTSFQNPQRPPQKQAQKPPQKQPQKPLQRQPQKTAASISLPVLADPNTDLQLDAVQLLALQQQYQVSTVLVASIDAADSVDAAKSDFVPVSFHVTAASPVHVASSPPTHVATPAVAPINKAPAVVPANKTPAVVPANKTPVPTSSASQPSAEKPVTTPPPQPLLLSSRWWLASAGQTFQWTQQPQKPWLLATQAISSLVNMISNQMATTQDEGAQSSILLRVAGITQISQYQLVMKALLKQSIVSSVSLQRLGTDSVYLNVNAAGGAAALIKVISKLSAQQKTQLALDVSSAAPAGSASVTNTPPAQGTDAAACDVDVCLKWQGSSSSN